MPNVESWVNIGVPSVRTAAPLTSPRFGECVCAGPDHETPWFVDSHRTTPCCAKPPVVAGAYSSTAPDGSCTRAGRPTDRRPEATVWSPVALDQTLRVEAPSL